MKKEHTIEKLANGQEVFVQHRPIKRLTFKHLLGNVLASFNIEAGLLYTTTGLLTAPGLTIRAYLGRHRYLHFSPVKFLLLSAAIATFVSVRITPTSINAELVQESIQQGFETGKSAVGETETQIGQAKAPEFDVERVQQVYYNYFNLFIMLMVPCTALFSYLWLGRPTYNYVENLAANAYIMSIQNVLYVPFLFLPLSWLGNGLLVYFLASIIYHAWAYLSFYQKRGVKAVIAALLTIAAGWVFYFLLLAIIWILIFAANVTA